MYGNIQFITFIQETQSHLGLNRRGQRETGSFSVKPSWCGGEAFQILSYFIEVLASGSEEQYIDSFQYYPLSVGFAQHPTGLRLAVHLTFIGSSFLEYLVLTVVTVPRKQ